jgi:hypothetical protein
MRSDGREHGATLNPRGLSADACGAAAARAAGRSSVGSPYRRVISGGRGIRMMILEDRSG